MPLRHATILLVLMAGVDRVQAQASPGLPSREELEERIAFLANTKTLPTEPNLLFQERTRLESDIALLRSSLTQTPRMEQARSLFEHAKAATARLASEVDKADCSNDDLAKRALFSIRAGFDDEIARPLRNAGGMIAAIAPTVDVPQGIERVLMAPLLNGTEVEACRNAAKIPTGEPLTRLLSQFQAAIEQANAIQGERLKNADTLLKALNERRSAVETRINAIGAKEDFSSKLFKLIGMMGIVSLLTMCVVKWFSDELQMEWVASGQITQFMTVMLLLSVVMGLGLVDVLKENTLGTLLGGIAGYVLAQGVGKAAAREAARNRNPPRPNIPPPPPPAPAPVPEPVPERA